MNFPAVLEIQFITIGCRARFLIIMYNMCHPGLCRRRGGKCTPYLCQRAFLHSFAGLVIPGLYWHSRIFLVVTQVELGSKDTEDEEDAAEEEEEGNQQGAGADDAEGKENEQEGEDEDNDDNNDEDDEEADDDDDDDEQLGTAALLGPDIHDEEDAAEDFVPNDEDDDEEDADFEGADDDEEGDDEDNDGDNDDSAPATKKQKVGQKQIRIVDYGIVLFSHRVVEQQKVGAT